MRFQEAVASLSYRRDTKFSLVGSEPYFKDLFIRTAKKVYADYSCFEFFPEEQNEALAIISSGSFFEGQLLILNNFNKMKVASFSDLISEFGGVIILSMTDKVDVSSRVMTSITGQTAIVECNKLREYGNDYPLWIKNHIVAAGYTVKEGVEDLIFSKIGPNMFVLSSELEKIFIVKSDKIITMDDVNAFMSVTNTSSAFDIFENLIKKDVNKALVCFRSYSRTQDSYIDIISFIGSYLEKMYRILLLREQKFEADDIADIIGIPKFMVKIKYLPRALSFGKDGIASKIDAICNLDAQLRLFKGDKSLLVEKFIMGF